MLIDEFYWNVTSNFPCYILLKHAAKSEIRNWLC
ncbi:hypothetical protein [Pseudomonas phage vB_Pae_SG_Moreira_PyoP2]